MTDAEIDNDEVCVAFREESARRRAWLTEWFGDRCDDVDEYCPVCRQWRMQDEWEASVGFALTGPAIAEDLFPLPKTLRGE